MRNCALIYILFWISLCANAQNDYCFLSTGEIIDSVIIDDAQGFELSLQFYKKRLESHRIYFNKSFTFYKRNDTSQLSDKTSNYYYESKNQEAIKKKEMLSIYRHEARWEYSGQEKEIDKMACKEIEVTYTKPQKLVRKYWITEEFPQADFVRMNQKIPGYIVEYQQEFKTKDGKTEGIVTVRNKVERVRMPRTFQSAISEYKALNTERTFKKNDYKDPLPFEVTRAINGNYFDWLSVEEMAFEIEPIRKGVKSISKFDKDFLYHSIENNESTLTIIKRNKSPKDTSVINYENGNPIEYYNSQYTFKKEGEVLCKIMNQNPSYKLCYEVNGNDNTASEKQYWENKLRKETKYYFDRDRLISKVEYGGLGSTVSYHYNDQKQCIRKDSQPKNKITDYTFYPNGLCKTSKKGSEITNNEYHVEKTISGGYVIKGYTVTPDTKIYSQYRFNQKLDLIYKKIGGDNWGQEHKYKYKYR